VFTHTGKNTAMATSAIFEASPKPKASRSSGIKAIFGIGNSAAISGSIMKRTGRNIAISSPQATPGMAPMKKPPNTRSKVTPVCIASSPLSTSCQNRTAMSVGAGMKRRSPSPAISSSCQSARNNSGEIM